MIDLAVVGLGKMGLSHLAMIKAHPDVNLVGVCDSTRYVLDVLGKYTGVPVYTDLTDMLDKAKPAAVIIATPTHLHAGMVRQALERRIHVFCEKPLFTDPSESAALTDLAAQRGLVTQVGYHNRFVASFREVHRLLGLGAIGPVTTALAEAYGPVVLKPAGRSWRSQRTSGGGSLYDDRVVRARLAQAFGRLIRRDNDHGIFVILSAAMPSRLLSAFPPAAPVRRVPLDIAIERVAASRQKPASELAVERAGESIA